MKLKDKQINKKKVGQFLKREDGKQINLAERGFSEVEKWMCFMDFKRGIFKD